MACISINCHIQVPVLYITQESCIQNLFDRRVNGYKSCSELFPSFGEDGVTNTVDLEKLIKITFFSFNFLICNCKWHVSKEVKCVEEISSVQARAHFPCESEALSWQQRPSMKVES